MRNISKYSALSESIREIAKMDSAPVPDFHSYRFDKNHTIVFSLTRGSAIFATSWRENPESRDSNAVMKAIAGEFVLFLPGEPYIMRSDDQSLEVSMYVLD